MADPSDWQERADHFRRLWQQEWRRRRRAERYLNKLLHLDRRSLQSDMALEQLVALCQQMTRAALAHAGSRKA